MPVDTQRAFSSPRLVVLFNEWMRRYTEEPETYQAEFQTVGQFLRESAAGKEPSYGAWCAEYLARLEDEIEARTDAAAAAKDLDVSAPSRRKPASLARKLRNRKR